MLMGILVYYQFYNPRNMSVAYVDDLLRPQVHLLIIFLIELLVSLSFDPPFRYILSWKNNFPLQLIQEELVVSYWQKNGH